MKWQAGENPLNRSAAAVYDRVIWSTPLRNIGKPKGSKCKAARLRSLSSSFAADSLQHGIKENIANMTQAEKSQLRYYAIMTQVTTAQGDMSRTLSSPANQLRILQANATQAARALGNIFIPSLNAVLPYAIAFLKVLGQWRTR
jgi:hypothetical protein